MQYNTAPETNTIVPLINFASNEIQQAKSYWSAIDFHPYTNEAPWSTFVAAKVVEYTPHDVFEFGCNAGKNLLAIKQIAPHVRCHGIDVNSSAIAHAIKQQLSVAVADETILSVMPDQCFDVCYTVSVMDHLPNPGSTLAELGRLSKRALLLLEPWLGEEGKVLKNYSLTKRRVIDTTPYSYSWDYERLGRSFLPGWHCAVEPFQLESNLGRYYSLYSFVR
jgi:ubiquinone/menaquinone biosynthesis C-methylase UbiE